MAKARRFRTSARTIPTRPWPRGWSRCAPRELIEHADGVLDTTDIERVHDMRVATRRLRAALEVFEPCFPRKRFKAALREVKALADALGERRDRDVTIAALDAFAEAIGAGRPARASRASIAALRDEQARGEPGAGAACVTAERLAALARAARRAGRGGRRPDRPADGRPGRRGARRRARRRARPASSEPAPATINGDEPR